MGRIGELNRPSVAVKARPAQSVNSGRGRHLTRLASRKALEQPERSTSSVPPGGDRAPHRALQPLPDSRGDPLHAGHGARRDRPSVDRGRVGRGGIERARADTAAPNTAAAPVRDERRSRQANVGRRQSQPQREQESGQSRPETVSGHQGGSRVRPADLQAAWRFRYTPQHCNGHAERIASDIQDDRSVKFLALRAGPH